MKCADDVVAEVLRSGAASDAAAGCAVRTSTGWVREQASSGVPGGRPDVERFFDLASLTKPMTAVAVAVSGMDREKSLAEYVPELGGTFAGGATIEQLLAHRTGLAAHRELFAPLVRGEAVDAAAALREAAEARRPELGDVSAGAWHPPLYSDLGYLLAGVALARSTGLADAGDAIHEFVVAPLGSGRGLGSAKQLERLEFPFETLAAPTEDVPWRGGVVRGRVHDENAWALTGAGASGHAGVFGTVSATLAFGCAVLDALDGLPSPFRAELGWLVAERPGGTLRAGFDGKSNEGSSAGSVCSPHAFGHLGFTGTSLWVDPDAKSVVVVLSNRVHPTRENAALRPLRPLLHDALFRRARELERGR